MKANQLLIGLLALAVLLWNILPNFVSEKNPAKAKGYLGLMVVMVLMLIYTQYCYMLNNPVNEKNLTDSSPIHFADGMHIH